MIQIAKFLQIGCGIMAAVCLIGAFFTLTVADSRPTGVKLLLYGLALIGCILLLQLIRSHAGAAPVS